MEHKNNPTMFFGYEPVLKHSIFIHLLNQLEFLV